DLVTMCSYAPLFVHAGDRKWNPDAIQFDGLHSCGTPSYWMQTLLAAHRPDVLLPCDVPQLQQAPMRGSIGLGTWRTQAEFKDVEIESGGDVVYRSAFGSNAGGWSHEAGTWQLHDGALAQNDGGEMRWTWLPAPVLRGLGDYTVRCKARKLAGDEGF